VEGAHAGTGPPPDASRALPRSPGHSPNQYLRCSRLTCCASSFGNSNSNRNGNSNYSTRNSNGNGYGEGYGHEGVPNGNEAWEQGRGEEQWPPVRGRMGWQYPEHGYGKQEPEAEWGGGGGEEGERGEAGSGAVTGEGGGMGSGKERAQYSTTQQHRESTVTVLTDEWGSWYVGGIPGR